MIDRSLNDMFPLVGWQNPFANLDWMSGHVDRLSHAILERPGLGWLNAKVFPAVNLTEDKHKYYVRAELPGIKADALDIQVTGKNLTITGERTIPSKGDKIRYHRREREAGKFSRVIGMPGDIDADNVEAKMAKGVLTIAIAKSEASKPKQITVN